MRLGWLIGILMLSGVGVADVGTAAALEIGKPAPDFTLPATTGEDVSLRRFRGQKLVLIEFFGAAFAPTCAANVQARGADYKKFRDLNVEVLAISSDNTFALKTYADSLKIPFPLLSDQPLKAIRSYGVLAPDKVRALRAFFLIDQQGILRKQWLLGLAGDDIVFSSEPIVKAIEELAARPLGATR